MVGSSPLILLNDLILTSNTALAADQQMTPWGLFSVTPIGVALVVSGILYFIIAGRFILPATNSESSTSGADPMAYFQDIYGVDYSLSELVVTEDSGIIGKHLDDITHNIRKHELLAESTKEVNSSNSAVWQNHVSIPDTPEGFTLRTTYPANPDANKAHPYLWRHETGEYHPDAPAAGGLGG